MGLLVLVLVVRAFLLFCMLSVSARSAEFLQMNPADSIADGFTVSRDSKLLNIKSFFIVRDLLPRYSKVITTQISRTAIGRVRCWIPML
jgi:hypothetical protein